MKRILVTCTFLTLLSFSPYQQHSTRSLLKRTGNGPDPDLVHPDAKHTNPEHPKPDPAPVHPTPEHPGPPASPSPLVPPGNTSFAFNLFHTILQQDSSKNNKLISPLSIYLSLCIIYNGAGPTTKDSIAEALQLNGINISNLNALCKNLLQEIHLEDNKAQISLAHSIWCNRKKGTLLPSFTTTADNYYYTDVQSLDFNAPNASARFNDWISQNTGHRIAPGAARTNPATPAPRIDPKDLLYLTDAAYFTGDWSEPFDAGDTYKDLFYIPDGQPKTVAYMKRTGVTRVFSDTSFTMLELPYGNGKAFSMYILLPDDPHQPLRDFTASLKEERWKEALLRMNDQSIQLSLPAWEYGYSIPDLQPVLSQLGMSILFDKTGGADLSGMIKTRPGTATVSRALHNTYVTVNEKGTGAGVATATTSIDSPGQRPHRTLSLKVDHPFLYLILEKQRNILLFAGTVNDPTRH